MEPTAGTVDVHSAQATDQTGSAAGTGRCSGTRCRPSCCWGWSSHSSFFNRYAWNWGHGAKRGMKRDAKQMKRKGIIQNYRIETHEDLITTGDEGRVEDWRKTCTSCTSSANVEEFNR